MNEHIINSRESKEGEQAIGQANNHLQALDHGVSHKLDHEFANKLAHEFTHELALKMAHSTPDPDAEPTPPNSIPDDIPPPAHAPVQEPTLPEPPIKADKKHEL